MNYGISLSKIRKNLFINYLDLQYKIQFRYESMRLILFLYQNHLYKFYVTIKIKLLSLLIIMVIFTLEILVLRIKIPLLIYLKLLT
ncbi:hypothetical protein COK35_25775 [Bacillus cereus]|nr:hypothetical protein CN291_30890 [Bacillus cereus]PFR46272.1 hypothetical protein COK35_25775 [Bacillus cereus]PGW22666.1 hypothetical protein COD88_26980 [Bacillus cereus]